MTSPFSGIRILDFTRRLPGAMATMLFADFGADVVRVSAPAEEAERAHPGYLCWDRNKRRVALDVKTYEGLAAARRLLARSDAAVFDSHPGELERLGLDATTLVAANPALVHAWLPPYGTEGRWSQLPADELLIEAVSGLAHMQFSFEDQPVALVTPQVGYAHATIAANAIAAALWDRRKTGLGQALTVTGLHAVASIASGAAITAGAVVRIVGNSRGAWPHYRLYRCADGEWFFLGSLTAPFFMKVLEATDLVEIMAMPEVNGEFAKVLLKPALGIVTARLESSFAARPRAEWLRILHDHGVPCAPVGVREAWFRGETVASNNMRIELEHPKHGRVEMPGVPIVLEETPGQVRGFCEDMALESVLAERDPLPLLTRSDTAHARRPLEAVRVLDLGAFIAGTFAPTVLANLGADVIKIEPIGGDPFRPYGLIFFGHNLGKRSLAIDIKHPDGRKVFEELVRRSDVVLDNFRLGVRERLGIDFATLSAINRRIITCSVTGYGPKGELAADPGFDPLVQARSGMMCAQGGDDEPVFHQIAINDTATAMMAAFAILAALHARETTGRGQQVQTCLANQSVLFQSGELTWYEGRPPSPIGGRDFLGFTALRRFYQCADGWIGIAATNSEQFELLAEALGHPEWTGRMTAAQAAAMPANGELVALITLALQAMPVSDALDRLHTHGVPAAPARRHDELFTDHWLAANRFFREYDDPQFGHIQGIAGYADWCRSIGGFPRRAPVLGEHTVEILEEFGMGAIAPELLAKRVIASG